MRFKLTWVLAAVVAPALHGEDLEIALIEGRRAVQAVPEMAAPRSGTNAWYTTALLSGAAVLEPVRDPRVTGPDGIVRRLAKETDGRYSTSAEFSDLPNLRSAFPFGTYDFGATVAFLGDSTGHVDLSDSDFPPFPTVANFAAAQAVDPEAEFVLRWKQDAAFASGDRLRVSVREVGTDQPVTEATDLDPATTEWFFAAGTFEPSKRYALELAVTRLVGESEAGEGEWLGGRAYRVSETLATLATGGGGTPVDTVPPRLTEVLPGEGAHMANAREPVVFRFDEPMDTAFGEVAWSATLNGVPWPFDSSKFANSWSADRTFLIVTYDASGTGWPAGIRVQWRINGEFGDSVKFRDAAGNRMEARSGTFGAAGGVDPCSPEGAGSNGDAAFAFAKSVHYVQTDAVAPVADPERGALAMALLRLPPSVPVQSLATLKVPTANPHAFRLMVLTPPAGGTGLSYRMFEESYPNRTALDDAYPEGTYALEIRDAGAHVTNSVPLIVSATGYPPIPRVANYADCQGIDAGGEFRLRWDPFAGAVGSNTTATLEILDSEGDEIFRAPDPCRGTALDPGADGVRIPANTFRAGKRYEATLTFGRVTDAGKTLGVIPGFGFAALSRATRFSVVAAGSSGSGTPLRFGSVTRTADGRVSLEIQGPPGSPVVLESASAVGTGFGILVVTNFGGASITLSLPIDGVSAVFRARRP